MTKQLKATDVIGRPIEVDDYVFHYVYVYKVLKVTERTVVGIIQPPSKTSKKKVIYGRECAVLPNKEVMIWMLTTGKGFQ